MDKSIKIAAICGSPHRGNTYEILRMLKQSNPEIDFKILMLSELDLKDCFGCYSCINNGEDTCPHKDDRDLIIEEMKNADATIFASPTYARAISALMKKFVERTSFMAHRPIFFGKYAMALSTCGGFGADLTCKYLTENFTQYGFNFVPSVELMVARKTENETARNRIQARKAYVKLISAIKAEEKIEPTFAQLVYFNIFKSISEWNKLKGRADYEFYQDKKDYYYDIQIPFWKKSIVKWIAGKEIKKMKVNTST
ncbi:flavodoxin family protein [Lentiprolixibacter aurantiacus]|uniref:NAD(P)H-dependent oxidoreductase n=1 Tax=Lentiprolixibacter aurantiacus TaxID=2993939 RepID=A0AAE3SMF2_9FLAO|nr:NAD(P)H-dependent oxidoreductase [Lentiprolixibacter aurantiacus]MCX2718647.1 NAD(P)H-dependent oxidoreductase [Lentiprolixibacter aurantiacus]